MTESRFLLVDRPVTWPGEQLHLELEWPTAPNDEEVKVEDEEEE